MYIFQGLDLSTAHIRPSTDIWIKEHREDPDFPIDLISHEHGYVIWVFSCYCENAENDMGIPDDLWACIQYAFENDCRIINLDADAEYCEGLPRYDAEWGAGSS